MPETPAEQFSYNPLLQRFFLSKEEKELFHKIFELNFSQTSQNILSPRERKTSLSLLLKYLSLHIDSFADLISLQVLKQLDV